MLDIDLFTLHCVISRWLAEVYRMPMLPKKSEIINQILPEKSASVKRSVFKKSNAESVDELQKADRPDQTLAVPAKLGQAGTFRLLAASGVPAVRPGATDCHDLFSPHERVRVPVPPLHW